MTKRNYLLPPKTKEVLLTKEECKKAGIAWPFTATYKAFKSVQIPWTTETYIKALEARVKELEKKLKNRPIKEVNHYSTTYVQAESEQDKIDRYWRETDTRIGGGSPSQTYGTRD